LNPALIKANPKYLSALKAQTEINRRRLLEGDWLAVPEGSQAFTRGSLIKLDKRPLNCKEFRAWDFASEEPSDKNRHPDFTTSVKLLKPSDGGNMVLVGDYEPESQDPKTKVYGKYRQRSGERDKSILRQAHYDGDECIMVLAVDPASAGKFQFTQQSKYFAAEGFIVKPDPMPNNKSKFKKAEPFLTACQNGNISIVESSFGNKETLDSFYKELEMFDGERSTTTKKDDIPDSASSCYNAAIKIKTHRPMRQPTNNSTTSLSEYKKTVR